MATATNMGRRALFQEIPAAVIFASTAQAAATQVLDPIGAPFRHTLPRDQSPEYLAGDVLTIIPGEVRCDGRFLIDGKVCAVSMNPANGRFNVRPIGSDAAAILTKAEINAASAGFVSQTHRIHNNRWVAA